MYSHVSVPTPLHYRNFTETATVYSIYFTVQDYTQVTVIIKIQTGNITNNAKIVRNLQCVATPSDMTSNMI